MQFGAKILPFQGCVGLHFQVCTSPGLCVPVGIYLSPGVSRTGEAFVQCQQGGVSPSQSLPASWKGNAASRMCWAAALGFVSLSGSFLLEIAKSFLCKEREVLP